jgi:hypothetical protein
MEEDKEFLPKEYSENKALNETGGSYMKFTKGINRFRIMSSPIVGWEWWEETEDGKRAPKRVRINEKLDVSTIADPESIKRFWAMCVYNYELKKIQILEITQKGIQRTLEGLVADEDWGTPVQTYDIVVTRSGDGMETKYEVLPKPKTEIDKGIIQLYKDMHISLEALFDGDDPFAERVTDKELDEVDTGQ